MPTEGDWRLRGQGKWLKGAVLQWKVWTPPRPGWDHDHCDFCTATFTDLDLPDVLREGYTTADSYHWVCKQCFEDFQAMFEWKVR